jgi:hypothetical protein
MAASWKRCVGHDKKLVLQVVDGPERATIRHVPRNRSDLNPFRKALSPSAIHKRSPSNTIEVDLILATLFDLSSKQNELIIAYRRIPPPGQRSSFQAVVLSVLE